MTVSKSKAYLFSAHHLTLKDPPPLLGEGRGGDGFEFGVKTPHPPPDLPLEGGGTWTAEDQHKSGKLKQYLVTFATLNGIYSLLDANFAWYAAAAQASSMQ